MKAVTWHGKRDVRVDTGRRARGDSRAQRRARAGRRDRRVGMEAHGAPLGKLA